MLEQFMLPENDLSGPKLVWPLSSLGPLYKNYDCLHVGTTSSGLEQSLADLHREALFLPRSTLSGLKEIGQGKISHIECMWLHDCPYNYNYVGQYGKVYKGLYRKSQGPGHPVAVKTIKQYESEKEKDEFLREMNVMSKLMHPNIVRLFGLVQQGMYTTDKTEFLADKLICIDEPWIVLEFLPHGDLKHFLMVSLR